VGRLAVSPAEWFAGAGRDALRWFEAIAHDAQRRSFGLRATAPRTLAPEIELKSFKPKEFRLDAKCRSAHGSNMRAWTFDAERVVQNFAPIFRKPVPQI
jgi:hypothetical protein